MRMHVNLYYNARTTLAIRRGSRELTLPTAELARRSKLDKPTVVKWRRREDKRGGSDCLDRETPWISGALRVTAE